MDSSSKAIRIALPLLVVLVGVLIAAALVSSRKPPSREQRGQRGGALVEVIRANEAQRRVIVEGTGSVVPRHEIVLSPQVTGKVVWVSPELVAGGLFGKGDQLVRIEPADYHLAVQRAEAQVAQAEYQLEVARANASIAGREWELMNSSRQRLLGEENQGTEQPDPLVLHEPQLRQAEANLTSAQAGLESAKLSLNRTVLHAPFNCRVRRQSVSPGQLIGPATQVAVLYGTDVVEIEVGLPLSELEWIEVPGSAATVTLDTGDVEYQWGGRVNRTVGVLDEIGRLARVVVRVEDPFRKETQNGLELSIGSFVSVEIEGRLVERSIPLPRAAIRENSTVWVAAQDSTLQIRKVKLHRMTSDEALVAEGVAVGESVVLTPLAGAAEGMKLRPVSVEKRND